MFGRLVIPFLSTVAISLVSILLIASSPDQVLGGFTPVDTAVFPHAEPDTTLFRTTVRQRDDFSCGAAALATLLIHHYGSDVTDHQVFASMLREGDEDKIRSEGFSMLDMKQYLDRNGYESAGYEMSLDRLGEMGLPGIVLITVRGLNHFVVVKGVSPMDVLLGDPVMGIRAMPRSVFDDLWNGMVLVISSLPETGRRSFNRPYEWEAGLRTVASKEWRLLVSKKVGAAASSEQGMMSRADHSAISR